MMKDVSSIPAEAARRFDVPVEDGVTIAAYELKDCPSDAPVLLWGHANGFSAGSYLPLLQLLSKRFNVFAYDVRGQGASTTPPEPFTKTVAFDRFAHDMERVANTVQAPTSGKPLYFAGHSFSAATMYYLGGG
ncbi:MAG: alpha/beta fold hydrolase, partial [Pseudomonadota bacterium]|nr:alpha/beta fold hydrolase [Pseudomonadota bacterium]